MKMKVNDMIEILYNPLINNSEVARQLGMTPSLLKMKISNYSAYPYAKLTHEQVAKFREIFMRLRKEIDLALLFEEHPELMYNTKAQQLKEE